MHAYSSSTVQQYRFSSLQHSSREQSHRIPPTSGSNGRPIDTLRGRSTSRGRRRAVGRATTSVTFPEVKKTHPDSFAQQALDSPFVSTRKNKSSTIQTPLALPLSIVVIFSIRGWTDKETATSCNRLERGRERAHTQSGQIIIEQKIESIWEPAASLISHNTTTATKSNRESVLLRHQHQLCAIDQPASQSVIVSAA